MGDSSQSSGVFSVGFRAGFWRRKRIECFLGAIIIFFLKKTQYFHHEKKINKRHFTFPGLFSSGLCPKWL